MSLIFWSKSCAPVKSASFKSDLFFSPVKALKFSSACFSKFLISCFSAIFFSLIKVSTCVIFLVISPSKEVFSNMSFFIFKKSGVLQVLILNSLISFNNAFISILTSRALSNSILWSSSFFKDGSIRSLLISVSIVFFFSIILRILLTNPFLSSKQSLLI